MIEELLKILKENEIITLNEIAKKLKTDKEFVKYLIKVINKTHKTNYKISKNDIVKSEKCIKCPYYKK